VKCFKILVGPGLLGKEDAFRTQLSAFIAARYQDGALVTHHIMGRQGKGSEAFEIARQGMIHTANFIW